MTKRILFIFKVREELQEYLLKGLSHIIDLDLIFPETANEEELLDLAPEADLIVGWRPSQEILNRARKLKVIINPGVGVQHHIDQFKEFYLKQEITLINGHGNTYFTAQHAVALLLSLTNKIIPHHNWMMQGHWRRGDDYAKSLPMRNRRIGLLGYGAVNRKVHRLLSGFDAKFHLLKRSWNQAEDMPTAAKQYIPQELDEFLSEVDTLIIAVPQTHQTIGMIRMKELEMLGPNGLLINVARGSVVDERALFESLSKGVIAGAGIDVWYEYQPEADVEGKKYPFHYPFHELDNVILSPHRGNSPVDDLERWDEVIQNILQFSQGHSDFINVVNLELGY